MWNRVATTSPTTIQKTIAAARMNAQTMGVGSRSMNDRSMLLKLMASRYPPDGAGLYCTAPNRGVRENHLSA